MKMFSTISCYALIALMLFVHFSPRAIELSVPKPRSQYDISYDYHLALLTSAIIEGSDGDVVPTFTSEIEMQEGRATRELIKGQLIDVYWLGTDYYRESQLRPIRIPTTRGLIGYRKLLIRKDSEAQFNNVQSIDDLKKYTACQGTGWPDTVILKNADIRVETTPALENLFKMLAAKRCDFFPRGLHDHGKELQQRKTAFPSLSSYSRILIHYPFAVYFFVNQDNADLANMIEKGLEKMIDTGQFDRLMRSHALTRSVFPLEAYHSPVFIPMKNTIMSETTDTTDQRYWIQPLAFGIQ